MQVESPKPTILLHNGKLQHCIVDEYVAPTTPAFKLLNLAQPNQEVNKTVTAVLDTALSKTVHHVLQASSGVRCRSDVRNGPPLA